MAERVLAEDLVLVQGQQERMKQGGDIWGTPVSYDKARPSIHCRCIRTNSHEEVEDRR